MKHGSKNQPPSEPELLDLYAVCVALHVSPAVAEYICSAGILPAHKQGMVGMRVWRVRQADLDEFLGKASEAVGSIQEFYARIEAARKRREEAYRMIETHLEWGEGQGDE